MIGFMFLQITGLVVVVLVFLLIVGYRLACAMASRRQKEKRALEDYDARVRAQHEGDEMAKRRGETMEKYRYPGLHKSKD